MWLLGSLYVSFASVMTARASYLPLVAEMAGRTWILCCMLYSVLRQDFPVARQPIVMTLAQIKFHGIQRHRRS
ncbi:hypothetical protein KC359_g184 [Hortaea werneckii]|nr:hypothetical protein KC359_g184 [Hortaea werneckii]